jgi:putative heme-binding domain-containing protein
MCEPAHNLVSRAIVDEGALPGARRAGDEEDREFLASSDVWFRPVQARTGPDGALYIVDLYRFLIEHPRWIPADRMATIDPRAGADLGRIYRIIPAGIKLARIRDLTLLTALQLAQALDSSNGTERDRIQLRLLEMKTRNDAAPVLTQLARSASSPEVRVHSLCMLDILGKLTREHVAAALTDPHARVREHGVRLSEHFASDVGVSQAVMSLDSDRDLGVRMQLALSLGEYEGGAVGETLERLARSEDARNPWFRAALASSSAKHPLDLPVAAATKKANDAAMKKATEQLLAGVSADRSDVVRKYAECLTVAGHAARGREIFAQRCAVCHRLDDAGFEVGPNLAALRDKPADYWLKNILDPNAVVEPAAAGSVLELSDGRVLAGVIKAETATSFTLAGPGGFAETVLRAEVKSKKAAPRSLMPDGLEAGLGANDLADLIAFLRAPR